MVPPIRIEPFHSVQEIRDLYSQIEPPKSEWRAKAIRIAEKVIAVAILVLTAAVGVTFLFVHAGLFAIGFAVGFAADQYVQDQAAKVRQVCAACPLILPLIGAITFLAWPYVGLMGSFVCGAYISSRIVGSVTRDDAQQNRGARPSGD